MFFVLLCLLCSCLLVYGLRVSILGLWLRWPPVGEQCLEEQSLSLPHRIRRSATASAVSFKFNCFLVGRQNRTANYFPLFWEN